MQDDTRTASRLMDSFELALRLAPPQQAEEDGIRRLERLIGSIEITDAGGAYANDQDVVNAVRALMRPAMSPPAPTLRFHAATAHEHMRTLYRTWATDVRPSLVPYSEGGCEEPAEEWLQLARLNFGLDANGDVAGQVVADESERPVLVQTRVMQEGW